MILFMNYLLFYYYNHFPGGYNHFPGGYNHFPAYYLLILGIFYY